MKTIYLDHAGTTAMKPEVLEAMVPYFVDHYGNASTVYRMGQDARAAVDKARDQVAKALNADPAEIYFTGCGTESDNWAIRSVALRMRKEGKGKHIITSNVEHHAVLHTCEYLEKLGFEVTYLPVDENGWIDPEQVEKAIREDTILITIMYANNEIGTIMPIREIGEIAKKHGVLFHTDGVQAIGQLPMDVKADNIDLLSLSAHKFNGPKGVGALYARKGVKLDSFLLGGAQERGKRAGTENVPGIVGLGRAIELATENREEHVRRMAEMRDALIHGILETIPFSRLNGHATNRLPNNVNISFEFIEGESLLIMLDMKNIAASSGSACTSGSLDPSHVLLAIGLPHEKAHGSLRMTLGDDNTMEDVQYVLETLPPIVERLRAMSPLFEQVKGGERLV